MDGYETHRKWPRTALDAERKIWKNLSSAECPSEEIVRCGLIPSNRRYFVLGCRKMSKQTPYPATPVNKFRMEMETGSACQVYLFVTTDERELHAVVLRYASRVLTIWRTRSLGSPARSSRHGRWATRVIKMVNGGIACDKQQLGCQRHEVHRWLGALVLTR